MIRVFLCLLFSHVFAFAALAQQPVFHNLTVENGLPSNEVYHIMEDSKGYLWFCSDRGVSRFDGHTFTNYTVDDGLIDNTVFRCVEDKEGRIWFASMDAGLSYFQDDRINRYKYNENIYAAGIKKYPKAELIVLDDRIIIISAYLGYSISNNGEVEILRSKEGMKINALVDEVYFVHPGTRAPDVVDGVRTNTISFLEDTTVNFLSNYPVHPTMLNMGDTTIFSPVSEVFLLTGNTIRNIYAFDHFIDCFYRDSRNGYWVSVVDQGVRMYHGQIGDGNLESHFFQTKTVSSILEDREGGFWFSVLGEGLYYAPNLYGIQSFDNLLRDQKIADMCFGFNNTLFISYENGEIWELSHNDAIRIDSIENPLRHGGYNPIYFDSTSGELITTKVLRKFFRESHPRLVRLHTDKGQRELRRDSLSQPFFTKLGKDSQQGLWMGTHSELYYRDSSGSLDLYKVRNNPAHPEHKIKLYVDAILPHFQGKVWIGSYDGISSIDDDGWKNYSAKHELLGSRIDDIAALKDSLILFASRGMGIIIFDGHKAYQISDKNGLSNNFVNTIALDKNGVVWAGTNNGLNRIVLSKDGNHTINVYSVSHGLISNHISKLLVTEDRVYVGTNHGLCILDSRRISMNKVTPLMKLIGWNISGESSSMNHNVELSHDQNSMSFRFIGITFNNARDLEYQYKLEGLESRWQSTHNSIVRYNSLSPGSYTFYVKAKNVDGLWSEPVQLSFSITPPVWKQNWFIILMVLILILLLIWFVRRRDRILAERVAVKIRFEQEVTELKLKALRAQINPHFTFNTLNSVQNFIENNETEKASEQLSKFGKLIRQILENSNHELITLKEELDALHKYLDLQKQRFQTKLNYEISIDESVNADTESLPPTLLQPIVENSIIHGIMPKEGAGTIRITCNVRDGFLICKVTDNGVGRTAINTEQFTDTIGLNNTRNRLSLLTNNGMTGKLEIIDLKDENNNSTGTTVVITIPRKKPESNRKTSLR